MLREIAGLDGRFRVIFGGENLHISGNSNAALAHARGEWIALCDHDDLYTPDALYWVMDAVEREQPDFLYSDEDKVTEDGRGVLCRPLQARLLPGQPALGELHLPFDGHAPQPDGRGGGLPQRL